MTFWVTAIGFGIFLGIVVPWLANKFGGQQNDSSTRDNHWGNP